MLAQLRDLRRTIGSSPRSRPSCSRRRSPSRRVWPAAALVFSAGRGHRLDAVRRSAALQRQRVRDSRCWCSATPPAPGSTRGGACVALWSRAGAALGMGARCPGRTARRRDRADRRRRCSTSPCCSSRPGSSAASSAGTALGPARFASSPRRPPPSRRRTTRRRSPTSGRGSAPSFRTSSPTASARWSIQAGSARLLLRSDPDRARDVDPQRRADRPPGAQRPAPAARDAAQGRRPARAQPATRPRPARGADRLRCDDAGLRVRAAHRRAIRST